MTPEQLKNSILQLAIQGKLTEAWREKTPSVELSLASSPTSWGRILGKRTEASIIKDLPPIVRFGGSVTK